MNSRGIPVITMGLSAILLQIAGLRQLLAVFSGNELDIGITLSVWLTAVGIGSFAGHKLKFKNAIAYSFITIGLLAQPTILFTILIRPLLSIAPGEIIPLSTTVIATIASLLPLCFVIGLQFPLAVKYLGGAARAYGFEAAGSFIGGMVFTLILSNRADVFVISATISAINFITAIFLMKRRAVVVLLLIPAAFYFGMNKANERLQWKGFELTERIESRYGEISVLKAKGQFNVYSSSKFQFSYPDSQSEETKAHLVMTMHPAPSSILVIGGSPAVLREILKYPVSRIDFVEIDPEMINVSFRLLSAEDKDILKDSRLKIITQDARRFVKTLNAPDYDIVFLNLSEPSTANANRFYTIDFFMEAKALLESKGILSLTLPFSSGYISKRMQIANGAIYYSLKKIFKNISVSSEEYGYLSASESPIGTDPEILAKRFAERKIDAKYFHTHIFYDVFSSLRVQTVKERLEKINVLNTDARPVAYLYNLMLWSEIHGGKLLNHILEMREWHLLVALCTVLVIPAVFLWRKKNAVYYSILTTGYSAMSFSLIIMLSYQALFGYVYERLGLLTAFFMIGISSGSYLEVKINKPLKWLRSFEAFSMLLFLLTLLFLKNEPMYYLLCLLCGTMAGVQFAAANLCISEKSDDEKIAGRLYAADLMGSFAGAFLTSIIFVPLLGIQNALICLVLIKLASLGLLLSIGYEKS